MLAHLAFARDFSLWLTQALNVVSLNMGLGWRERHQLSRAWCQAQGTPPAVWAAQLALAPETGLCHHGIFTVLSQWMLSNSFLFHQIYISSGWFYRIFQAFLVLLPNKNNLLTFVSSSFLLKLWTHSFLSFFQYKILFSVPYIWRTDIINYREFRVKKLIFWPWQSPRFSMLLDFLLGFSFLKWNEGCLRWFHF